MKIAQQLVFQLIFFLLWGCVISIIMKYGHKSIVLQDYTNQARAKEHIFCSHGDIECLT